MPEWAAVLIAAFVGGLLGAVVRPIVGFVLDRARAGEEIRKQRERSLRRMVTLQLDIGEALMRVITGWMLLGQISQDEKFQFAKYIPRSAGLSAWAPERIDDPDLQEGFADYTNVTARLRELFWAERLDVTATGLLIDRLMELRTKISRRMDELNWPEVDD